MGRSTVSNNVAERRESAEKREGSGRLGKRGTHWLLFIKNEKKERDLDEVGSVITLIEKRNRL